ncbi:MAG: TonB-dependent receptor [Myxococcota bacterium]|nr:TonB-dependent receptor [Myxococcota bacterium]
MTVCDYRSVCALLSWVGALSVALPALATDLEPYEDITEFSLEELLEVDVASLDTETIFESPSMVSVIDRAQLELYGFESVSEAVEHVAGASVMRTHIKQRIPTLRGVLQDHYANKVLVLLDGIPAWHAVTGEGNLDRVSIDEVERIEVLLGPASVIHGTNAYSGAVNIVTRRPTPGSAKGRVGVRLHGLGGVGASGAYLYDDNDGLALSISAHALDSGVSSTRFLDEDGVSGEVPEFFDSASLTARARLDDGLGEHELFFNAYRQTESYLGVTPQWTAGVGRDHHLEGYLGSYGYTVELHDALELRLRTHFDAQERDIARERADNVRSRVRGWRSGARLIAIWELADWLGLQAGADYDYRRSEEYANYATQDEQVLEENAMSDRSVNEFSLFAQLRFDLAPLLESYHLSLLGGLRWTQNQHFNSNLSTRASLVWELFENSSVKLAFGQSFRAPTPFELYFETSSRTVFGNTSLKPETATTAELAYLLGYGKFFGQVLGYWSSYENKIYRTQRAPADEQDRSLIYRNGQPFSAWGVEAQLRFADPELIDFFINYALVLGDDGDELNGNRHYNFRYIPEHELSLGMGKRIGDLSISTVLAMWGPRDTAESTIPTRFSWDLSLAYQTGALTHLLWLKDALDTRVEQPEYVRRRIDSIPGGLGRSFGYTLRAEFD